MHESLGYDIRPFTPSSYIAQEPKELSLGIRFSICLSNFDMSQPGQPIAQ